ncbi:MAG: DUF1405 domain-containing protein [Halobacteriaceae archaeon]
MADINTTRELPFYVSPLPQSIVSLAYRFAWIIIIINVLGTLFGFWYYRFQFMNTTVVMWPFVPDSPGATLLMALSLALWKLDIDYEWIHVLAFYGNIKLGIWTPYVQLVLNGPQGIQRWLYIFLIFSHLAMVVQAFLIPTYAEFPIRAIAIATLWYGVNDLVDYFIPLVGNYHHTYLRAEIIDGVITHSVRAHELAAAMAITLTLISTFLALAVRVKKVQ